MLFVLTLLALVYSFSGKVQVHTVFNLSYEVHFIKLIMLKYTNKSTTSLNNFITHIYALQSWTARALKCFVFNQVTHLDQCNMYIWQLISTIKYFNTHCCLIFDMLWPDLSSTLKFCHIGFFAKCEEGVSEAAKSNF